MRLDRRATALALCVAAVVALLPLVVPSFVAFELTYAGAYAIAILGLVILTGYNGQISLGHGAFMAIGGYAVALAASHGLPLDAALLAAALACAVAGGLVGIVALRLAGAYLALATFSLAVVVAPLLKRFKDLTGGAQGLSFSNPPGPATLGGIFGGERLLYYETWTIAGALFLATCLVLSGRFGRSLRAVRDHEIAAVSFGIDAARCKTIAFAWSAAYAGIAGALIARATAYVSPDTYNLQLSITLLVGAVLGGLGSLWGALAGGVVVEFLPLWTQALGAAASPVIYGIALIVVMIALPGGIAGAARRLTRSITRPRAEGTSARSRS